MGTGTEALTALGGWGAGGTGEWQEMGEGWTGDKCASVGGRVFRKVEHELLFSRVEDSLFPGHDTK